MDEEIERLIVAVRADTKGFARDVGILRAELDGPLAGGLERAGRTLEQSLAQALRNGRLGFEDLRNVAVSILSDIGRAAIESGIGALFGGGVPSGPGGLLTGIGSALGGLFGAPGRATGGPVSPGRPYRVGENGPEIFVPASAGRVETGGFGPGARGGAPAVNLTIQISDNGRGSAADGLQRSSRHIARAVRQAMARASD